MYRTPKAETVPATQHRRQWATPSRSRGIYRSQAHAGDQTVDFEARQGSDWNCTQSDHEATILQNALPVNYYCWFINQKVPVY